MIDANEGLGGSYTVNSKGERELVERTQDHKDGNRARDAHGRPIGNDGRPIASEEARKPAPAPKGRGSENDAAS